MTAALERDHQNSFFEWLRVNESQHPILKRVFAIPNGGKRDRATAIGMYKEGLRKGVLDIHLPAPRNGKSGLWIEFKAGSNTLTDEQTEWKAFLELEGYEVHVVRDWTDAARLIATYLKLALPMPYASPTVDEFRRRRTR